MVITHLMYRMWVGDVISIILVTENEDIIL